MDFGFREIEGKTCENVQHTYTDIYFFYVKEVMVWVGYAKVLTH